MGLFACAKDGATKEILAHYLSSSLELSLVKRTLRRLLNRLDGEVHPEAIFHSDQGFHYTHPDVRSLIDKAGFKQSMSRKGSCWDNASMETFLRHMKDELELKDCSSLQELRVRVNEYITYYNTEPSFPHKKWVSHAQPICLFGPGIAILSLIFAVLHQKSRNVTG